MPTPPPNLSRYAWLSVAAAVAALGLKLLAWRLTGSVGLLSDALEGLANLAAALIAVASLKVSSQPPDAEHSYGHTKVEYFAGGIEGAFILLAAGGIGWNAVNRLFHPQALERLGAGMAAAVAASLINLVVSRVLHRVGTRHHSVTLIADARHLLTDVWTSGALIIGLAVISVTGWHQIDAIIGVLLCLHILFAGVRLLRDAFLGLMDTGLPENELKLVQEILRKLEGKGIHFHALRTRLAGTRGFMSVHLLVPGAWSVYQAHEFAEAVETEIRQAIPRLTVTTHIEPLEDPVSWHDAGLDR